MEKVYKTKNLFVATYLMASSKVKFLGTESLDYKSKQFLFTPYDTSTMLETEYFSGGSLPAKHLFAEYNSLKDILFQKEPNGDNYGNT